MLLANRQTPAAALLSEGKLLSVSQHVGLQQTSLIPVIALKLLFFPPPLSTSEVLTGTNWMFVTSGMETLNIKAWQISDYKE